MSSNVVGDLRRQALVTSCPLTAGVLARAADDVEGGGPLAPLLAPHANLPTSAALPLRLMGAAHRLALAGEAPGYAAHLPTCGGDGDVDAAWRAMRALAAAGRLEEDVREPVQTNEPGRLRGLVPAFAAVHAATGLPLRLLELGASAGLLLEAPEGIPVVGRRGCDPHPLDPRDPRDRRLVLSFVWASQIERFRRVDAALEAAAARPPRVDRADAAEWLPAQLAGRRPGRVTLVFHSVVWQYLPASTRQGVLAALDDAGRRATDDAPLAYVRFEPTGDHCETWCTTWPGRRERLIARAGFHGDPVELVA